MHQICVAFHARNGRVLSLLCLLEKETDVLHKIKMWKINFLINQSHIFELEVRIHKLIHNRCNFETQTPSIT